MSNHQAIYGVTETLRSLLRSEMENDVIISFGPPDLKPQKDTYKKVRINLYLYKIKENNYLKNQEIFGQGNPGAYGYPPLSLMLHYLLTVFPMSDEYNEDYDLEVHKILGDAMRIFHDYSILTDYMVINSDLTDSAEVNPDTANSSGEDPDTGGIDKDRKVTLRKLLHSSLQNQFEKIKIVLEPLDTEELTKIWMGLNNPYRLSVGYAVSVVQIESMRQRKSAPQITGSPRVHTMQV